MAAALVWLFFIHATSYSFLRPVLFKTVRNKPLMHLYASIYYNDTTNSTITEDAIAA